MTVPDRDKIEKMQAMLTDAPVDTLGITYKSLRKQEAELLESIEEKLASIKDAKLAIEWEIRKRLNEQGLQSFKLKSGGNFHVRTSTNYHLADLDKFYKHLEDRRSDGATTDVYGAFPKRINKDYVKAWNEKTGAIPPGLDVLTERKIIFQQR